MEESPEASSYGQTHSDLQEPTTPIQKIKTSVKALGTQLATQLDSLRVVPETEFYGRRTPEKPGSAANSVWDLKAASTPKQLSPTKEVTDTNIQEYFQVWTCLKICYLIPMYLIGV